MNWPSGSDYVMAVQNPGIAFLDPDLRGCKVAENPQGTPIVYSGGFTTTFRLVNHHEWAVRCFIRSDVHDLGRRYQAISAFIRDTRDPLFVSAEHVARGILVNGTWYPVVKMEWARGERLDLFLAQHCRERDTVLSLAEKFRAMVQKLDRLGISHGDLQHGNILVRGEELRLVDYDGMYLPSIRGLGASANGLANFQHPMRNESCFGPEVDRFSSIVIYVALLALSHEPSLWNRYDNSENILFRQADFVSPDQSALFVELQRIPEVSSLVDGLKRVCALRVEDVPSLEEFLAGKIPQVTMAPPAHRVISVSVYRVLDGALREVLLKHIGDRVEVVGHIDDWSMGKTKYDQPYCFLNFGLYPRNSFCLVLWNKSLAMMKDRGLDPRSHVGKWVSVTGVIGIYAGKPQMEIEKPSQIQVLLGEAEAAARLGRSPAKDVSRLAGEAASLGRSEGDRSAEGGRSYEERAAATFVKLYKDFPSAPPTQPPIQQPMAQPAAKPIPKDTAKQPTVSKGEVRRRPNRWLQVGCGVVLASLAAIFLWGDLGIWGVMAAFAIGWWVGTLQSDF